MSDNDKCKTIQALRYSETHQAESQLSASMHIPMSPGSSLQIFLRS